MTLEDMLATPGIYQVTMGDPRFFFRVEVDDALVCHQLTADLVRDGVLAREGWSGTDTGQIVRLRVIRRVV